MPVRGATVPSLILIQGRAKGYDEVTHGRDGKSALVTRAGTRQGSWRQGVSKRPQDSSRHPSAPRSIIFFTGRERGGGVLVSDGKAALVNLEPGKKRGCEELASDGTAALDASRLPRGRTRKEDGEGRPATARQLLSP